MRLQEIRWRRNTDQACYSEGNKNQKGSLCPVLLTVCALTLKAPSKIVADDIPCIIVADDIQNFSLLIFIEKKDFLIFFFQR